MPKPTNVFSLKQEDIRNQIVEKVKVAVKAKFDTIEPINKVKKHRTSIQKKIDIEENFSNIITIGTSTGGPRALQALIPQLPADIDASIVIVQHMPPKFTKSLADRLNSISNIKVKEAEEGDILLRGHAYIAPGDYHLR